MILLVDASKSNLEITDDGNITRSYFGNPEFASLVTEIDEILIRKLPLGLTTINWGHEIEKLYSWYYMPKSLHKEHIHGGVLVNGSILPIGQMSEETIEAWN
ncbi:hypothetical protein TNCV_348791 [Trichonephila clavipes]|nr:hypothetical protein TNCV_348791 [Trichonephila clavipes]